MTTQEKTIEWITLLKEKFIRTEYSIYLDAAIKALEQTDKMFFISEILVRESKWEITPEKVLNYIRDILMGYTFWDKESEEEE